MTYISDLESEIVNQPGLQIVYRKICLENHIIAQKNESSILQDKGSDTKFSCQRLPWISFKVT